MSRGRRSRVFDLRALTWMHCELSQSKMFWQQHKQSVQQGATATFSWLNANDRITALSQDGVCAAPQPSYTRASAYSIVIVTCVTGDRPCRQRITWKNASGTKNPRRLQRTLAHDGPQSRRSASDEIDQRSTSKLRAEIVVLAPGKSVKIPIPVASTQSPPRWTK